MKLFGSNTSDWKETLIKDLIIMSIVDNDVDPAEVAVVIESGVELGISESRVRHIMRNPDSIKSQYPSSNDDKIKYLEYLLILILADSKIDEHEIEYLYEIANRLSVSPDYIKNLLAKIDIGLKSNFENDEIIKLEELIDKKYNLMEGVLGNISNDLNDGMAKLEISLDDANDEEKLIKMSYAYARRTAAAGLFLQGVFSRQDFQHAQQFFQAIQIQTIHTVDFQEDAADIATKFLLSYDSRLTKKLSTNLVLIAMEEEAISLYDMGRQITFDNLYETIASLI